MPFYSSRAQDRRPTSGGGGAGTVLDGATPIVGAVLEFRQAGVVIGTATTDGSGNYTAPALASGSYDVMCHPPLAYQMASAEPETRAYTHPGGPLPSFECDAAYYAQDFQAFASTTALHSGSNWGFPAAISSTITWQNGGTTPVVLDSTGGPGGSQAMRFDFPVGGVGAQQNIGPEITWSTPLDAPDIWVLWTHRLTADFWIDVAAPPNGGVGSYKIVSPGYGDRGGLGFDAQVSTWNGVGGDATRYRYSPRLINSPASGGGFADELDARAVTLTEIESWHTIAMRFTQTATGVTLRHYWNGDLFSTLTVDPWSNASRDLRLLQYAANMNSGPGKAGQSRWTRELAVYTGRPGLRLRF